MAYFWCASTLRAPTECRITCHMTWEGREPHPCGNSPHHQASAVFFVVGRMVEDYPDIVHTIAAAGHEIGLPWLRS